MEAAFYMLQAAGPVPFGSTWFHYMWNATRAIRMRDIEYGSVVPRKNNIHYKLYILGRWSTLITQ